jgi:hypothetical protein
MRRPEVGDGISTSGFSFVDHPVKPDQIINLRIKLADAGICRSFTTNRMLHVNFLELGSARGLHNLLSRHGSDIERPRILDEYQRLFQDFNELPSSPVVATVDSWVTFQRSLALKFEKNREWMETRRELSARFYEMLGRLGVLNKNSVVTKHFRLRRLIESNYTPHLTLGKGYSKRYHRIDVSGMQVRLDGLRLVKCVFDDVAPQSR